MSVSGLKSSLIASRARRHVAGESRLAPTSACSAFSARFGVAAMPPQATRALTISRPSRSKRTANMTAEMSSSRRFRHLESAIVLMGREPRRLDGNDKLARAAILLAVSDEEVFERHGTHLVSLAQNNPPAKSD